MVNNLAAKSYLATTVYLRNLGFYCELKTSPKAFRIVRIVKTKAFRDGFTDFVRRMEGKGRRHLTPGSTIMAQVVRHHPKTLRIVLLKVVRKMKIN